MILAGKRWSPNSMTLDKYLTKKQFFKYYPMCKDCVVQATCVDFWGKTELDMDSKPDLVWLWLIKIHDPCDKFLNHYSTQTYDNGY